MKKIIMAMVLLALFFMMLPVLMAGWLFPMPLPKPKVDPNTIPFAFDTNQVKYQIIGWLQTPAQAGIGCSFNWGNGDPNFTIIECENPPAGLQLIKQSNTDWRFSWTPAPNQIGISYIDFWIYDSRNKIKVAPCLGTLIIKVLPQNPEFLPMCGS
jgi:hypothetical protein